MLPSEQKFRIFIFWFSFIQRIFPWLEFWKCLLVILKHLKNISFRQKLPWIGSKRRAFRKFLERFRKCKNLPCWLLMLYCTAKCYCELRFSFARLFWTYQFVQLLKLFPHSTSLFDSKLCLTWASHRSTFSQLCFFPNGVKFDLLSANVRVT